MKNWFVLKKELAKNNIFIQKPLFHATRYAQAKLILEQGLRAKATSASEASESNAVCFSRSLDYYYDHVGIEFGWEFTDVIFIFDEKEIKHRLKLKPYNFYYEELSEENIFEKGKTLFEYEERAFCTTGETVVPAKYIKAAITKYPLDKVLVLK